ncbi:hypothetical protein HPB47_000471 [Ixodes persulcatus]|uniref:Uncharacterized protein n=1 Tax=Ixodes persulcatus TaxID=34615 RepID=A0AC60PRN0_IXOPE|nr:hypothetical protein HPB47_000471 [Ixodes persulcatus]
MANVGSLNAVRILKGEAEEEKAETARLSSFVGAIAIGDLMKSTLGPKGMDKILMCNNRGECKVEVTNDGATILKAIGIDNPAAKILVDISKVQDDEVGDGTTSVTVLASELLKEAEQLISKKLHPQTIVGGWRKATAVARQALEAFAADHSTESKEQTRLTRLPPQPGQLFLRTTEDSTRIISGRWENNVRKIASRVVGRPSLPSFPVNVKQKSLNGRHLPALFLTMEDNTERPKRVEKARILIANTPMDADKVKVFGSRVRVESVAAIADMELAEKVKMKEKVDQILKHNISVFINRQLIYNYPEQLFADAGVMAIEHADFDGIERLALVTGGEIVSTFASPELVRLGTCDLIEEVMIGEDKLLKFSGVPLGEACTIVLRGATQQILDEAERSLHDALCVLSQVVKDSRVVFGGGSSEMLMASAVSKLAESTPGKESLAMEGFARALRQIPTIIADNAGFDSAQLVSELRAAHSEGKNTAGINMTEGCVDDMCKLGVTEAFVVKRQVLLSASEAAEMILRVDNIIKAAPRQRHPDRSH